MKIVRTIYRKITPFQMITASFTALILVGSLLLWLPVARVKDASCTYLDALFTSCSAVCVTGLVVKNTATFWTVFGKTVLLLLIQAGGLGVITIIIAVSIFTGKRIGLRQRNLMQNVVSAPQIGGIIRFTRFLLLFTLSVEGLGSLLLLIPFVRDYGPGDGMKKALFHSVSAFCNAGFDLLGDKTAFASLTAYHGNILLNLVIMALIVTGGLGFLTWEDLIRTRFRFKRLKVQSKLILISSAFLILIPAVLFFFFEFDHEPLKDRLLLSAFQSVTTRTAGFNTADFGSMHEGAMLIMIVLMLIGGSPGSTAGGLKTTTFSVILIAGVSYIRQEKNVHVLGRSIGIPIVLQAFTLMILYVSLLLGGSLMISMTEGLPILKCLFECASALGTVGLTMGITPSLGNVSKIILILFMYFGRVGGLTLAYATLTGGKKIPGKLPEERIIVG